MNSRGVQVEGVDPLVAPRRPVLPGDVVASGDTTAQAEAAQLA